MEVWSSESPSSVGAVAIASALWTQLRESAATFLPLSVTPERAGTVFAMTLAMCAISGLLAVRKVRRLDPAEVF